MKYKQKYQCTSGFIHALVVKRSSFYVEKKRCVAVQMTALSSTTAVFLKESKGAYLSVLSETADTDTKQHKTFHGPLLSLAQDVMKTNWPQQNTCFDVQWHSAPFSFSLFLFLSFYLMETKRHFSVPASLSFLLNSFR